MLNFIFRRFPILEIYADKRTWVLFFLGFSAGVPLMLIFSSLSLWLNEAGVSRDKVTMFSWAALAYSFKFVWAPLIDALPLPVLTRILGKRRSWLLAAQILVLLAILAMSAVNPSVQTALFYMALSSVLLGFSSATQDVVIDAYRIEIAADDVAMQSATAATYAAGYRVGLIASGWGALVLAQKWGSSLSHYSYDAWRFTYWAMSSLMLVGILTTWLMREPDGSRQTPPNRSAREYLLLLLLFAVSVLVFVGTFIYSDGILLAMGQTAQETLSFFPVIDGALGKLIRETVHFLISLSSAVWVGYLLIRANIVPKKLAVDTWVLPITDFFHRYGKPAWVLLALIGLYRISDIVAGVVSNLFYAELGFSKEEIATAVKAFGFSLSIFGGFVGGLLAQRVDLMKMMMAGAVLASLTNLLFVALDYRGYDVQMLYVVVSIDNLAAGLSSAVFLAFLSSLTNIRFTAVQYAIFSSLMSLLPKTLGGYSGTMVNQIGYAKFFLFTSALGIPVLILVYWAGRLMKFRK